MRRRAVFAFLALFGVVAALSACGGGGSNSSLPAPGNPTSSGVNPNAAMTFHFPAPASASTSRSPRYLSPSTASVVITITAVNGAAPSPAIPATTFNVTAGVAPCKAATSSGFSCTETVGAVAGSDTFQIQAFSGANGGGSLLSTGSLTVTVNPTGTTVVNTTLVLGAVTAAPTVATPSPGVQSDGSAYTTQSTWIPPVDGTKRTLTLIISATDASGNTIVGALASPIPLQFTDPSSGTLSYAVTPTANASGASITAVPAKITLTYSGASFYSGGTPTSGTLKVGSGSSATTIAISPLQVASSTALANATVGIPFTVTVTEAGFLGANFAATATSSGGTLQVACAPGTPPTSGATTLLCNTTSSIVTFDVAPTGLGTGGSLAISDANGVVTTHPFNVTPPSGGGVTVPPHTIAEYTVFATPPPTPAPPQVNLLLGMTAGPTDTHLYFSEGSVGALGSFLPSACLPASPASCAIASLPITGYASPFPLLMTAYNGAIWFGDDNSNFVYSAHCVGSSCAATAVGATIAQPAGLVNTTSGLMQFSYSGGANLYQPTSASWLVLNSPLTSIAQANLGFGGEGMATGASSGLAYLIGENSSLATPTSFASLTYCGTSNPSTDTGTVTLDGLALGSDGNLWVVEKDRRYIAAISPALCIVGEYPLPALSTTPPGFSLSIPQEYTVVAGPDGNLWVTDPANNSIDRVTTSGASIAITIPTSAADPYDIIAGPDGNLWFTEATTLKIGEVVLQ